MYQGGEHQHNLRAIADRCPGYEGALTHARLMTIAVMSSDCGEPSQQRRTVSSNVRRIVFASALAAERNVSCRRGMPNASLSPGRAHSKNPSVNITSTSP